MKLKTIEKIILNLVQRDFPVAARPYKVLAAKFNMTEEKVLEIFRRFKKTGLVRRITPSFRLGKIGHSSVLAAVAIPLGKINAVGSFINKFEEITHNYVRAHKYNFWFTIMSSSPKRIKQIANEIEKEFDSEVLTFPVIKTYKLKITAKL